MTTPTDYKALAEEVLALAKHVSWEACFGPGKYAIHAEKENCHKLFWGVDELARAVLALDGEIAQYRTTVEDVIDITCERDESRRKYLLEWDDKLNSEIQRLRAALENYVTYDHDWFNLDRAHLKQAREALERKP